MDDVLQELDNIRHDEPSQMCSLMDKAQRILSKEDDGVFAVDEANKNTEELEELLYRGILTRNWPGSEARIEDFDKLSPTLPSVIIQLKERVFQEQTLEPCGSSNKSTKICQYCNWALERLGRGRHSKRPDILYVTTMIKTNAPLDIVPSEFKYDPLKYFKYAHLCAVDSSQQLPLLRQRSQDGCALCGFIRDRLLVGLQDSNSVPKDSVSEDLVSDFHFDHLSKHKGPLLVWLQSDWGHPPFGMEQRGNILQSVTT